MVSNIKCVQLDSNVYEMLVTHALSNEKEEIMGLLIGNITNDENDTKKSVCNIYMSLVLERLDKRADRVEISPEQLSLASEFAEKISEKIHKSVYIIGWYHSHPRITVLPSHVDIRTQLSYQMLDRNFIGIIISVYNQTKTNFMDNIELICFQSNDGITNKNFTKIPIKICVNDGLLIDDILRTLFEIPKILIQEEKNSFEKYINDNKNNFLCSMSNCGIYLHTMSQIIDKTYLEMLNTLKCRIQINDELLQNSEKLLLDDNTNEIAEEEN